VHAVTDAATRPELTTEAQVIDRRRSRALTREHTYGDLPRRNVAINQQSRSRHMNLDDLPAPADGFVITHFLVVSDQDRSREFYRTVFDAKVALERDPVILKVANTWLILNVGGGPTDDKPTVTLTTPPDPDRTSAFLNVRVADIHKAYEEWSAKGATFLTEPKDHGREIRAYIRDPDGHLIEVGQATGILG
jgi:lactoylglutathione lyase